MARSGGLSSISLIAMLLLAPGAVRSQDTGVKKEFIDSGRFFSQAASVLNRGVKTVYVSGQVGRGEDFAAQVDSAFQAVIGALESAGASAEDVVRIRIYVTDFSPEKYAVVSAARTKLFGDEHPPASTFLGIQSLMYDRFNVEIQAIAVLAEPDSGAALEKEFIDPGRGYSQAVVVNQGGIKTIYVSGQIGRGEDLAAQATAVYNSIARRLESAGATMKDVVKTNIYIANYKAEDLEVLGGARGDYFTEGRYPASTLIGVESLAAERFKIEIDAIAVLADPGSGAELEKEYFGPTRGFTQVVGVKGGGMRTLYISGQPGRPGGELATQADQSYRALARRLEAAGATPADLVMQIIYMTNYKEGDSNVLGAARTNGIVGDENNPTSTLIGVQALYASSVLTEVEAIAVQ